MSEYEAGDLAKLFGLQPDVAQETAKTAKGKAKGSAKKTQEPSTDGSKDEEGDDDGKKKKPSKKKNDQRKQDMKKKEEKKIAMSEKMERAKVRRKAVQKGRNVHASDDRMDRTCFIGNVPVSTGEKTIKQIFKEFGSIESLRFRSIGVADPKLPKRAAYTTKQFHEKRQTCNCYVVFEESDAVKKAVEGYNGKKIGGEIVRVDFANTSSKHNQDRSVFFGNLPLDTTEAQIRELFDSSTTIVNVRLVRDNQSGMGKGFGFVEFLDQASVKEALAFHDCEFHSRKLRVFKASDKPKQPKKTQGKVGGKRAQRGGSGEPVGKKPKWNKDRNSSNSSAGGEMGGSNKDNNNKKNQNVGDNSKKRKQDGVSEGAHRRISDAQSWQGQKAQAVTSASLSARGKQQKHAKRNSTKKTASAKPAKKSD